VESHIYAFNLRHTADWQMGNKM